MKSVLFFNCVATFEFPILCTEEGVVNVNEDTLTLTFSFDDTFSTGRFNTLTCSTKHNSDDNTAREDFTEAKGEILDEVGYCGDGVLNNNLAAGDLFWYVSFSVFDSHKFLSLVKHTFAVTHKSNNKNKLIINLNYNWLYNVCLPSLHSSRMA